MNIKEVIINFLKKFFNYKNNNREKLLEDSINMQEKIQNMGNSNKNFRKLLKVNIVKRNKIETAVCDGDGLGIKKIAKC